MTLLTQLVLRAFLAEPGTERYGLQLRAETGLPSGTIYPIVARLEQLSWVHSSCEDRHEHAAAGRQRPCAGWHGSRSPCTGRPATTGSGRRADPGPAGLAAITGPATTRNGQPPGADRKPQERNRSSTAAATLAVSSASPASWPGSPPSARSASPARRLRPCCPPCARWTRARLRSSPATPHCCGTGKKRVSPAANQRER
jgi:hypothetical protein